MNTNEYELILSKITTYLQEAKKILNGIEEIQGWKKIALDHSYLFQNTSFFMYGIEKYKESSTANKFLFLCAYHELYLFGFLGQRKSSRDTTTSENKLLFQFEIYQILGSSLHGETASQVILDSSFNPRDYNGKSLPVGSIVAYEFAPIIDAWFDMWIELKNEWKDNFNEKYLSYSLLNTLNPPLPAYQSFLEKRQAVIDHLFNTGRISTKTPFLSI